MKLNLLKLLAISAAVLSLASCTGGGEKESKSETSSESESVEPQPLDLVIDEVLEIGEDADATGYYKFTYEGEWISVEDMTICGFWGERSFILQAVVGETVGDLRGLEVELKEGIDPAQYNMRDVVTVSGTLSNRNRHAVIVDAEFEVTNAVRFDDNDKRIDGTGGNIYYWPDFSSGSYSYIKRSTSGIIVETIVQLIDVPTEPITAAGATLNVVFPGENTDLEDEDNTAPFLIEYKPGLNEKALKAANAVFFPEEGSGVEAPKAGDFITVFGFAEYNRKENARIYVENCWARIQPPALTPEDQKPAVFTSFNSMMTKMGAEFDSAVALPQIAEEAEVPAIFSYTYENYTESGVSVDKYFENPSFIGVDIVTKHADIQFVNITCHVKLQNSLAAAQSLFDAIHALSGWDNEYSEGEVSQGEYTAYLYHLLEDETCDLQMVILKSADEADFEVYVFGPKPGTVTAAA